MSKVPEMFGSMVFGDALMKERLPKETYKSLRKTIQTGSPLESEVAGVVANAMKDWAIEKGATHYTHWFQPMTGITAEKHDSFISPNGEGGIIMEFSGKELVKGEPDASSFPSGGLRATFEARGYTAWDPTSYAFIKDATLYIPTVFCSYGGEVLDKKTPLLRSMEAINTQALRILHYFGHDEVSRVTTTVGPEQEYFLVDKALFQKRKDLVYCGRTLVGAKPPKGQELEDHYFRAIRPRVKQFMADLDDELWKLGIHAKTEHNELTMEVMKRVADRHNLACLLHEKPFAGINGSGKHNNWSISTDTGLNLLDPGRSPRDNTQFLLFLCAVIKAVDEYQELLRISVATPGNDHRLGANEAPPAIISMFLGDDLTEVLDSIADGTDYQRRERDEMETGINALPHIYKDTTDRNRTSPFAFTGNKFEFRMLGSALNIAGPNIVLNTIVAEELEQFADALDASANPQKTLADLIADTYRQHKRIVFNGNNYSDEWVVEAERRGLYNLHSTVDALPYFVTEKNIELFTRHHIFSELEMRSRCEILLEGYSKALDVEARTLLDMVRQQIIPAAISFEAVLLDVARGKKELLGSDAAALETGMLSRLSALTQTLNDKAQLLCEAVGVEKEEALAQATHRKDVILPLMDDIRTASDQLEIMMGEQAWPIPTYSDLLTSV